MIRTIVSRLISGALTIVVIVTLAFLLLHAIPGDPVQITEDPSYSAEDRQRLREVFGLDQPAHLQFLTYVSHALVGDFGISMSYQRPVRRVLTDALGPTLLLSGAALFIAFGLGLVLGTLAGLKPGSFIDRFVSRALPALDALPPFWLGLLAIYLFSLRFGWLPASHMRSATGGGLFDLLTHLLMPALVLGLPSAAPIARHHAEALRRELSQRYVEAARAMGHSPRTITLYALRNALHPTIALAGLALPSLVGGAVVVEVVFSWPGLGQVHQQALLGRDVPLALGGVMLTGAMVVVGGVLADIASAALDPRWRRPAAETR